MALDEEVTIAWAATFGWMVNVGHFWPVTAPPQFRIGPYVSFGRTQSNRMQMKRRKHEKHERRTSPRVRVDLIGLNRLHLLVRAAEPLQHSIERHVGVERHREPPIA